MDFICWEKQGVQFYCDRASGFVIGKTGAVHFWNYFFVNTYAGTKSYFTAKKPQMYLKQIIGF